MILHLDCNSFYASCERAFRPDLAGKPIVVLSNNDGIIVALNKEAKALGIARCDAFFKVRDLIEKNGGEVFSSNYTLYADISGRIHRILKSLAPAVEPYSIDEFFLFFPPMNDIAGAAAEIKAEVETATGIPVSIGIAPTKVLAKLANKLAKRRNGILDVGSMDLDAALADYPVEDLWGIGWRSAEKLREKGVRTALDLKRYPSELAKEDLTIKGYYIVRELNGEPMIDRLEAKPKRNIIASKSFSRLVTDYRELEEAAAEYCLEAVAKLRRQRSLASSLGVFLLTNRFKDPRQGQARQTVLGLDPPSSYAPDLVRLALKGLQLSYESGVRYQKILIGLFGLVSEERRQLDFFDGGAAKERSLMACFDAVNRRYGAGTLFLGAQGIAQAWSMKREKLSPRYTTQWDDLPKAK